MTGTSLDALDCALVRIEGRGVHLRAELVATASRELGTLRPALRALCEQEPMTAAAIAALAREFSLLHAQTLQDLRANRPLDLACVHGQTVFHAPPVSWQLLNPWPIVESLGAPLVFDLRGADLAAGGQGAPITPLADALLFRPQDSLKSGFAVINLGGFANVTRIGPRTFDPELPQISGFDICACNQLLNAVARKKLGAEYDKDGLAARRGRIHLDAAAQLKQALTGSGAERRSLGTGDESLGWIEAHTALSGEDLAATACDAIGSAIVHACADAGSLILAGGGVRNQALLESLRRHAHVAEIPAVRVSDELGVPAEFREAMEFAVLGALCQDQVPVTLPGVTGVRSPAPLAGCWAYPSPRGNTVSS